MKPYSRWYNLRDWTAIILWHIAAKIAPKPGYTHFELNQPIIKHRRISERVKKEWGI